MTDFGTETTFSKEVDDKANAYFQVLYDNLLQQFHIFTLLCVLFSRAHQAIYNRGSNVMSVDRLLELLRQFKDSSSKKERVGALNITLATI